MRLPLGITTVLASLVAGLAVASLQTAAPKAAELSAIRTGIPHEALFSAAIQGNDGLAVGAGGSILSSADGGLTWTAEKAPTELSLLGVGMGGRHRVAVGQMGVILVKEDAGWVSVDSGTQERLMAVDVHASGLVVVAGSFGALLRSTDGGRSWSSAAPDWAALFEPMGEEFGIGFQPHLYSVKITPEGHILVAGELEHILRSEDGGQSWRVVHQGRNIDGRADPSFFDLALRDDGTAFVVGQSGSAMKSSDGGRSWQRVQTGTSVNLLGVELTAAGRPVVVGMREMLLGNASADAWDKLEGLDIATAWYCAVVRSEATASSIIVGHSGRILRLPD